MPRYAYSQVRLLSLPISQALALFTVFLPVATGISIQTARRLLRSQTANLARPLPTLSLILLLAFQLIYETIIATLAFTYFVPPSSVYCMLDEQWMRLGRTKNGAASRRIQDRYD